MFALPGMPHVFNMWPCRTGNGGSPHSHSVKKLFIFCRLADELRCKYVAGLHLSANISSGRAYRPKAMIACLFFFFAAEDIVGRLRKLSAKFREDFAPRTAMYLPQGLNPYVYAPAKVTPASKNRSPGTPTAVPLLQSERLSGREMIAQILLCAPGQFI